MTNRTARHCLDVVIGCCLALSAIEPLQSQTLPATSPTCLYSSKSFSEGALVCVQKFLMITCASNGTRAVWKPVTDGQLGDRCVAATSFPQTRKLVYRARAKRHPSALVEQAAAKCFTFNGKRYCE